MRKIETDRQIEISYIDRAHICGEILTIGETKRQGEREMVTLCIMLATFLLI